MPLVCRKTFGDVMGFVVDGKFDFAAQILDIIVVETEKSNEFVIVMGMGFDLFYLLIRSG